MIDLNARAVSDSQKILNGELTTGSFAVDLKFTDLATPIANTETIKGFYNDTSLIGISIETNFPITGNKIGISFHQSDLTIWDGIVDLQRWKVEFTNGASQAIAVEIINVIPDRSFGEVLCMCKIISGHR